ncbi:hypothetical protein [Candidatus Thiodictyon syntrophicum]|jgi:hypothetical protein|nr:hypothetical protein [Candidatus Thiodictyon syntrophicum]
MQTYEVDVGARANEQARLPGTRRFARLHSEHIAEQIEDAGNGVRG